MSSAEATASLALSYLYCERVAREQARNFYNAFLVLPTEKRLAFCAIYAFMRHSDDIPDDAAQSTAARLGLLAEWRKRLEQALNGQYGDNPMLPAFHDTLQRFSIPPEYFFELLRGAEMDLEGMKYATFADLYRYCYRVAGVVGLTCIHVFGFPPEQKDRACQLAESCGVAFQLTNILRDLREDAASGRVYLPDEDLNRFGCRPQDFLDPQAGERVKELMRFEIARTWEHYRAALPLLEIVSVDSRPSLWAMMALYSGILKRIEARPLDVFQRRVGLSDAGKFRIVVRALWLRLWSLKRMPRPF